MTTTVFTACGSDDDDNTQNPPADPTPAAAVMDYSLTVGDDMLNMPDLTVEYYDANGQVQSEAMTRKTWTKNVKAQLPATLGVRLKSRRAKGGARRDGSLRPWAVDNVNGKSLLPPSLQGRAGERLYLSESDSGMENFFRVYRIPIATRKTFFGSIGYR